MDEQNWMHEYRTGRTRPRKKHSGLITVLLIIVIFLGGIINAYQRWAEGKLNCTLDQVSSQIGDIICQSAKAFLETDWMRE